MAWHRPESRGQSILGQAPDAVKWKPRLPVVRELRGASHSLAGWHGHTPLRGRAFCSAEMHGHSLPAAAGNSA
jgi:hypothetical protein